VVILSQVLGDRSICGSDMGGSALGFIDRARSYRMSAKRQETGGRVCTSVVRL
jgi:hypothetical protein